jgi:hypothetical protein
VSAVDDAVARAGAALEPPPAANKGSIDVTPDGAAVNNVVVTSPINRDWTTVVALFNMDAAEFEVVDDTVRMSTWQQSKATEDGTRDVIQLYSYSARFKRISADTIPQAVIDEWRAALKVRDRSKPTEAASGGIYTILVADPQLGKKGTEEAVDNWKRGVTRHLEAARKLGASVAGVHVAFQGDETENVVNSYGNQPHTVELNRSRQMELDFDMRVWTMREALALRKPTTASSVISNHGEWTRNGGKEPVTTANDNASTHTARLVEKLFKELEPFTKLNIGWTIGDTHPGVTVNLAGVECYFSHGYVEKGRGTSSETRTRSAIERQILGRTDDLGKVAIWFMAHYHHHYSNEFEGRTLFGCPAIEAEKSSEYMLDQYGVWSPPGVLGMLVGEHERRGWSNLNVF